MRILYITTIGGTMALFHSFIKQLIDEGNTVDIACSQVENVPSFYRDLGCNIYQISCSRSPLDIGNIKAIREIKKLVQEQQYDIVHCHTPIASACTRIACRVLRKKGLKVIYTAHGFHFYSGAPMKNWVLYYLIEKICSIWTDVLITINHEDYERAKKKFRAKHIFYVPGVGIDLSRFENRNSIERIREEFSIPMQSLLLVSVGELNSNKNHCVIIRAIADLEDQNIHYIIAGKGGLSNDLRNLAKELNIESQIHLAGFRSDVPDLYAAADICVFPSIREGQGLAAIEGMASGLPVIASNNRGTRGFLTNNENAVVKEYNDIKGFSEAIKLLRDNPEIRTRMGNINVEKSKVFSVELINGNMKEIYKSV